MTRRARGFTLLEILVVCLLVVVVLGALFSFLGTTRRMNDASRGSAAVAGALLIEETLAMDMRQLGVDPARNPVFDIAAHGVSFYRTVFDGKAIRLRPVRYQLRRTAAGNARLERTEQGPRERETRQFDGILAAAVFSTTRDRRSSMTYLKVTMTVLPEDAPAGSPAAAQGVAQVLLARIPLPVQVVNPELAASSRMQPEGPLLALDSFN